jgi:hypothetical protein
MVRQMVAPKSFCLSGVQVQGLSGIDEVTTIGNAAHTKFLTTNFRFSESDGADLHCEPKATGLRDLQVFNRLDETLGRSASWGYGYLFETLFRLS